MLCAAGFAATMFASPPLRFAASHRTREAGQDIPYLLLLLLRARRRASLRFRFRIALALALRRRSDFDTNHLFLRTAFKMPLFVTSLRKRLSKCSCDSPGLNTTVATVITSLCYVDYLLFAARPGCENQPSVQPWAEQIGTPKLRDRLAWPEATLLAQLDHCLEFGYSVLAPIWRIMKPSTT
jgi:hypothetical protein